MEIGHTKMDNETQALLKIISDPRECARRFKEIIASVADEDTGLLNGAQTNEDLTIIATQLGYGFNITDAEQAEILKYIVSIIYVMGQRDAVKIPSSFDELKD